MADRHLFKQRAVMLAEPEFEELVELKEKLEKKTGYPIPKKAIVVKLIRAELERISGHLGIRPHDLLSGLQTASNAFSGCLA